MGNLIGAPNWGRPSPAGPTYLIGRAFGLTRRCLVDQNSGRHTRHLTLSARVSVGVLPALAGQAPAA
jgi:hypothetical protein